MVELDIAFRSELNHTFTVVTKLPSRAAASQSVMTETVFDGEDAFLRLIVAADLDEETTVSLVVAVILSVAQPHEPAQWVHLRLTAEQLTVLELDTESPAHGTSPFAAQVADDEMHLSPLDHAVPFYDFLMNAPTPFGMLTGPEFVFTFINPPYVQLLGRTSADQLLGLPVREALPEPGFKICLDVLEKAYKTGVPQARKELMSTFRQEDTGLEVEVYFDIVYQPIRDSSGVVTGIMAQATDVTERVLSRQVSESREEKLYRLWAELETIYAAAPVGMASVRATDLMITRVNKQQASFLNMPSHDLLHTRITDVPGIPSDLLDLLHRATLGEHFNEVPLEHRMQANATESGLWIVSLKPLLGPSGLVEAITLITRRAESASLGTPVELSNQVASPSELDPVFTSIE